jgi:hypothetical protein
MSVFVWMSNFPEAWNSQSSVPQFVPTQPTNVSVPVVRSSPDARLREKT